MVPDLYFQEELLLEEGVHDVRKDGSLPALGAAPARPPEGRGQRRRALPLLRPVLKALLLQAVPPAPHQGGTVHR